MAMRDKGYSAPTFGTMGSVTSDLATQQFPAIRESGIACDAHSFIDQRGTTK